MINFKAKNKETGEIVEVEVQDSDYYIIQHDCFLDEEDFSKRYDIIEPELPVHISKAHAGDNKCTKCNGTGSYIYTTSGTPHGKPCEECCDHKGEPINIEGKYYCKKGCGEEVGKTIKPMFPDDSTPYDKHDHTHCWEEVSPPCGQKIEHLYCCLCEERNPKCESKQLTGSDKGGSTLKAAAFCPNKDCDGNCQYQTCIGDKSIEEVVDVICSMRKGAATDEQFRATVMYNLRIYGKAQSKKERERLKKKALEYKEKGFELETFIYSGIIPDYLKEGQVVNATLKSMDDQAETMGRHECSDPELTRHCTGCTDARSEGTHQGCTIEHGHIGCNIGCNLADKE